MCCVVGYIGSQQSRSLVLEGLTRLEYRGYDSAGFACLSSESKEILSVKSLGGVDRLAQQCATSALDGFLGLGHTRWSTHGVPNIENAHPVMDCQGVVAVAHNGIIENHAYLRQELLQAGHIFTTKTDTEVIAHSLESALAATSSLQEAACQVVNKLEGAFAFSALMRNHPDVLLAVRFRSPLCIGIGDGGMFVASDQLAFVGKADKVVFLPDASYALVYKDHFEVYDFNGNALHLEPQPLTLVWAEGGKQGYEHYMLKEIYEQKRVMAATVTAMRSFHRVMEAQLGVSAEYMKELEHIVLIGCGTSWHAAHIAKFYFESLCKIPVTVGLASEFKHREFFIPKKSLCIAISQSGETADTLEVVRLLNEQAIPVIALTNVASSTLVRESLGFLLTQAGQEIAVASTKSFSAQVASMFLLAHTIALQKGYLKQTEIEFAQEELLVAAEVLEKSIETYKSRINDEIAPWCAQYHQAIFLGRHLSYTLAEEAALKLKEIAYIFAEAFPAGELKHGPIALVDKKTLIFLFSVLDPIVYQKLVSNAQEVKSRGGQLIVFAFEGQHELIGLADHAFIFSPVHPLLAPLAMLGVIQYLVYKIAQVLQLPIDKPRNLAKSVTVE